jgi:hypothetical protein
MKAIAVFCGSKTGTNPNFEIQTTETKPYLKCGGACTKGTVDIIIERQ